MPHSLLSPPKFFLLLLLSLTLVPATLAQTTPPAAPQKAELRLSWEGTPGINRYRLQVSRDRQFTDLVFDRAIEGREYVIADLPFGTYYWRVAPAAAETGAYSPPRTVVIRETTTGNVPTTTPTPGTKQPAKTGWAAATGVIAHPQAFNLREQAATDVVGVNEDGMVYALDATNGVALWTARFRPDAKRGEPTGNSGAKPFQPIALNATGGLHNIVVAHEGGVRAIEGATGRELWRASLAGRAASATAADLNGDGAQEIIVIQDQPAGVSLLEAATGRVLAQSALDAVPFGMPAAVSSKTEPGLLLTLADGTLDLRGMTGARLRSTKLDLQFTTPPLIVQTSQNSLAMLGTDRGLIAVDVATLKPLWRVATEGDAPRGQLAAADFDGDGAPEVVMITRRGRTVVVSTANGKIKWYANLPNRAGAVTLIDLNNDNVLDVLIAGDASGVIAHDGRSGSVIFGDEKSAANPTPAGNENVNYQTCAYLVGRDGAAPLLVCNDPAGGGLRAESLPRGK